ncbi:MAG: helix-turn-helix domain-containing protein [Tannerellaceae bacterium]|jgi:predicted DNA-binding transcriptional regulator AlpA|nr:helix-turn-helix domain-containing protein [Tannerellaceae bacterium]
MDAKEITFDNLPQAVAYLVNEVTAIKQLVENRQNPVIAERRLPIGIDAACQIIGKAKPTVYALVKKRLLPCYKNGKKLYFFEDELIEWIGRGKKKTLEEINDEVEATYRTKSKMLKPGGRK